MDNYNKSIELLDKYGYVFGYELFEEGVWYE